MEECDTIMYMQQTVQYGRVWHSDIMYQSVQYGRE